MVWIIELRISQQQPRVLYTRMEKSKRKEVEEFHILRRREGLNNGGWLGKNARGIEDIRRDVSNKVEVSRVELKRLDKNVGTPRNNFDVCHLEISADTQEELLLLNIFDSDYSKKALKPSNLPPAVVSVPV